MSATPQMETHQDLQRELALTQERLATLTDKVELNTRILKQSQHRELRLLQADNLAGLFIELTSGLAASYHLETASVVLADADHDIRHLLLSTGSRPQDIPGLKLVESLTGLAPQYVGLPRPWLGPFSSCDHQLIFDGRNTLGSIAMVPLIHRERLLGSVNFGSSDAARFTKHHATDFFSHLGVIASFALENAVNRARMLRSGFTDVLTGWNNRRYLQVRLNEELARSRRDSSALTCLMIDVDYFKHVNDNHGHAAGDEVLRELAQRIEAQVRVSDVAARYGGEEFVVLLPNTSAQDGLNLAERIRTAVSHNEYDLRNGVQAAVTVSIGVASAMPQREDDDLKTIGDSLLARADVALYRAKSGGRNRVELEGS